MVCSLPVALILWFFCASVAHADLTIMPLGDSVTHGFSVPGGYRTRLYTDLQNAGFSFTFVGTATDNPSPVLKQADQTHHEGHVGYSIDQIATNLDNGGMWFHRPAPPDIILLLIGGNDILQGSPIATIVQRLDMLIGQIVADSPSSLLFVSSYMAVKDPNVNQRVQDYNAQIRDVVVPKYQSLGNHVLFVDQYPNFIDGDGNVIHSGPDGIHPDQTGYDLMGDTWAAALQRTLRAPVPIVVTGYGTDVISDKDPWARFAQPFHAGTFAWFEAGAVDDNGTQHDDGLPAGLNFVSATGSGAMYQLQPPNASNVLQLSAGQTGTLTLATPAVYSTLYVLASSGDGMPTSVGSGSITFADGSTQAFSYNTFDWCNGTGGLHPEAVLSGPNGRADIGTDGIAFVYNQDCDFQIYETVIAIDPALAGVAIRSTDFTGAADAYFSNIFGVSAK